jgi:DNA-binding transcriptional regulator/RsmH inhibitor MraZ
MKSSYAAQLAGIEGFQSGEAGQVELAVLDRAGRVQIPREYLDMMNLSQNRLHVQMDEKGRLILTAPE